MVPVSSATRKRASRFRVPSALRARPTWNREKEFVIENLMVRIHFIIRHRVSRFRVPSALRARPTWSGKGINGLSSQNVFKNLS